MKSVNGMTYLEGGGKATTIVIRERAIALDRPISNSEESSLTGISEGWTNRVLDKALFRVVHLENPRKVLYNKDVMSGQTEGWTLILYI